MTINFYSVQRLGLNRGIIKHSFVSFLLYFTISLSANAQEIDSTGDPGDNPEWQMNMGKEAFSVENYKEALSHFDRAIGLYGQTNLEIQYFKAKSYYKLNELEKTQEEINLFFNLSPDSNYVYLPEMTKLKEEVDRTIKEEEEDYKRAINSTTIILLDAYIDKHPNGKHVEEIKAKKLTLAEDKAYQRAKNVNDINLYKEFVNNYPNSKYRAEAEKAIEKLDKAEFEKAVATNTDIALKSYINNATDSTRQQEAINKLNQLMEADLYNKVIIDKNIPGYRRYLTQYPNSEHTNEVRTLLKEKILIEAKQAEKEDKYAKAVAYYDDYLTDFPAAEDKSEVQRKREKAARKARLDEIPRRSYINYAGDFHPDAPANLGVSFGSLRPRGGGGFTLVRFNTQFQLAPEFDHSSDTTEGTLAKNNSYNITDNKRVGRFEFMIGFNRAIIKPLWIYAGFGLGFQQVLYEVEINQVNAPTRKTWSVHTEESKPGYIWELGLTANVFKAVTLNAGLASFNSETYYPTFGVGFSWKSKDQTK